ncbi:MAG: hypothetical protein RLY47_337 [Candidatus Parcubacteria bacterium]
MAGRWGSRVKHECVGGDRLLRRNVVVLGLLELPTFHQPTERRIDFERSDEIRLVLELVGPGRELDPPDDAAPMGSRILGGQVTRGDVHDQDLDSLPSLLQPALDEVH